MILGASVSLAQRVHNPLCGAQVISVFEEHSSLLLAALIKGAVAVTLAGGFSLERR